MATEAKEEQYYRRVFRHLDSDGDGKITAAELRRCVEMTEEEAEEALRAVAADGEGGLGVEEFVRMMVLAGEEEDEGERDKGLKEAFKMYSSSETDGRKGGWITPRSLKRMMSRLGDKRSVVECEVMISAYDLDGDGVLSFHEFKCMMS